MPIEALFPTLLFRGQLAGAAASTLNRELKRETLALEKIDDHGREWSKDHYRGGYSSYSSYCVLHQTSPTFADLEKRLAPHVRQFVRRLNWDLRGGEIRMTTCWINRMSAGTYHGLHVHPGSALSGVYYVEVPRGSSPLKIEDPRMTALMAAPPRRASAPPRDQNYILLDAKPGAFLLFESWLRHEVPPHLLARDRISVSFNYEWV